MVLLFSLVLQSKATAPPTGGLELSLLELVCWRVFVALCSYFGDRCLMKAYFLSLALLLSGVRCIGCLFHENSLSISPFPLI